MNNTAETIRLLNQTLTDFSKQTSEIFKKISGNKEEVEVVKPLYVNDKFKTEFKIPTVYRFNQQGMRYYCTVTDRSVLFYPSVTTIISKTTPMSYGLKAILAEKGMQGFNQFMKEKADYGTLLHILISDYLRSGNEKSSRHFDFDDIPGRVQLYVEENHINYSTIYWAWNLKKDLASLIQFIYDYNVEPIAIEAVGIYNDGTYHYAGALDLICYMTIKEKGFWGEVYKTGENKGQPKETFKEIRVKAIVDFKSGKSGFFEDYEVQLKMYGLMAEQSFGIKPDRLFNVAPKDWDTTPTYSIKDQTESIHHAKIPFMLGQYSVEWKEPKDILVIEGKVNGTGLQDAVKMIPASEFILRKIGKQSDKSETKATPEPKKVTEDVNAKDIFANIQSLIN